MKTKIIFTAIIAFLSTSLIFCQYENTTDKEQPQGQNVYLGLSSGINNFNGMLGGLLELKVANKISLTGGLGIGSWGYRASAGIRIYKNFPRGFYYTGSFSTNSGLKDFQYDLELTNGSTQTVTLDLNTANTLNLAVGYQWGNRFRFNIEGGYSVAFNPSPYKVHNNVQLSENSKQILQLIAPGGIILALGISYGF